MKAWSDQAWAVLRDAGVVAGNLPAPGEVESPWYVRLMLGFAGWFAALFLLGFVAAGLSWVVESALASVLTGLAFVAASWFMQKKWAANEFMSQGALAASFTGQALFLFGVYKWTEPASGDTALWLVAAVFQGALAVVMPSSFHRLWSAFAAAMAAFVVFHAFHIEAFAPAVLLALTAWLWLNLWHWPSRIRHLRPIAYGLSIALVSTANVTLSAHSIIGLFRHPVEAGWVPAWTSDALLGAAFLWLVWQLQKRWNVQPPGRTGNAILVVAVLLVAASFKAPGITVGVAVLLLGFANGNHLLSSLGLVALLFYISAYYYLMTATLLEKSGWLALTGVAILAGRWFLLRTMGSDKQKLVPPGEAA